VRTMGRNASEAGPYAITVSNYGKCLQAALRTEAHVMKYSLCVNRGNFESADRISFLSGGLIRLAKSAADLRPMA